jgi:xanthine dehydrogenase accessory factor
MRAGRSSSTTFDCDGDQFDVCCLVQAPPPRMIIFGAVDFAGALSSAARLLGYQVTICDARSRFAIRSRFPDAEVVVRWPVDYLANTAVDERTVVCIVTHDDKFDVPLIELALTLPVRYVGAMGSRVTHQRRMAALLERGHTHRELSSLHSPIGLDLGAETVEETAISILAEVLVTQSGASGASLSTRSGPIHQRCSDAEAFERRADSTARFA